MIIDSAKLKKLRESKKMSQAELAEMLQLSQATLWEWEKEDRNVKLEHLLKLEQVLLTDIREFIKGENVFSINNQTNNKAVNSSIIGTEVNLESYELQKDLIALLKKQVSFLEHEIKRLKSE
jgi:transcriptional regulator with XRE-family HTH domain